MKRRTAIVVWVALFMGWLADVAALTVCSFNVQFLGSSTHRDDAGLTEALDHYDIVVVQELVAPPCDGTFPNGDPYVPDREAERFFECMKHHGFSYQLSEEDTGPGLKNHLNSSATEWWVAFYKPGKVKVAADLPSGFLSPTRARNKDFDRVPYAFAFRTVDEQLDFVLISVHLRPGVGKANKGRRKHELKSITTWIKGHDQQEKDFVILGDMNIESPAELKDATPIGFSSLNERCHPTNTNVNSPKPYDHIMYRATYSGQEINRAYEIHVVNLIDRMRNRWSMAHTAKYPGGPPYNHNEFRKYYSDHHPVDFKIDPLLSGDDD